MAVPETVPGQPATSSGEPAFLVDGGEMGARIRAHDWSCTPLGPPATWPQSLQVAVQIMLHSRYPMFIWWGRELLNLYNDPYRPILGKRHPEGLGRPGAEIWAEIWPIIGPLTRQVFERGQATWSDRILLVMDRHGYREETYFTFSYSPILDGNVVGGIFCAVTEETLHVIGHRRLQTLRALGDRTSRAKTVDEACREALQVFSENPYDISFALCYVPEEGGRWLNLAASIGLEGLSRSDSAILAPPRVSVERPADCPWFAGERPLMDLRARTVKGFGPIRAFGGPWTAPVVQARLLPLSRATQDAPAGWLVLGISPVLGFDDDYASFFELVSRQLATAIGNAKAYEDERRRAEALAELDRAKTAFFNNVSHEFRTPLTLMLGPLEEMLNDAAPNPWRPQVEVMHRNGLRLLKLVNTLLDFARIEAGRAVAAFQPTDLSAETANLAAVFRSAVERAGLCLTIDCPPLPAPVPVDRDMWEKIVLNLVSNAFKHTFEGEIAVSLRPSLEGDAAVLRVRDTGSGIPAHELPRIFERFHQVHGLRARSHEGTGIGLALVKELVRLHGGTVFAESEVGKGSTFTVTVPFGGQQVEAPDRPEARPGAATNVEAFVHEAQSWIPDDHARPAVVPPAHGKGQNLPPVHAQAQAIRKPRVLLADDNADMRAYVRRLLEAHYELATVGDGESAVREAVATLPDLVLLDVMMPARDGLDVLKALRADPRTALIPIILLSGRAGEEARVDGLDAGADDYLVKPFAARELIARVRAHLALAQMRRQTEQRLREALERAAAVEREREEFISVIGHELRGPLQSMLGWAFLLGEDPAVSPSARKAIDAIERSTRAQARIVEDLLDLSRLGSGKLRLESASTDLIQILRGAIEAIRPKAGPKNLTLEFDSASPEIRVYADALRLEQVFRNLLDNAVKHTPNGGTVRIRAETLPDALSVRVSVQDTGAGIEPDFLPRVFEQFAQGRRQGDGSGLGLAISKQLVELHGGTISAHSDGPGAGATFTVQLPLENQRPTAGQTRVNTD